MLGVVGVAVHSGEDGGEDGDEFGFRDDAFGHASRADSLDGQLQ